MQDDKLKELIQAVFDGKELQWDFYYEKDRTGWTSEKDYCRYHLQRLETK